MKPNWSIILEALQEGQPVELVGYEGVKLDENGLYIEREGSGDLRLDVSLRDFLIECNEKPQSAIWGIGAGTAITKYNRKKRHQE
jgi:hypothetical protein